MKNFIVGAVVCLAFTAPLRADEIGWNFGSGSVGTLSPTSGVPVANLSVSDFSRTNGGPGDASNIIDSGSNSGGAYAGASGDNNAQAIAEPGALNLATSTWFEFTLTPSGGNQVTVTGFTFGSRSSSGGPLQLSIRSSLDNYATEIASANVLADLTWALLTPTTTPTSSGTNTPITVRIYASGGDNGNAVNWRLDDFRVSYTLGVVPEPPAWAMLGLGTALLLGAQWWLRKRA